MRGIFTLVILLVTVCFWGCKNKTSPVFQQLVDDHFKFMNRHDLQALGNQYAENAFISSPIMAGAQHGPLGAQQIYHFTFWQFPSVQYQVDDMITNDSTAVVEYDMRGFRLPNMIKSFFNYRNCTIFRIKNGKIISEITYSDGSYNMGDQLPAIK